MAMNAILVAWWYEKYWNIHYCAGHVEIFDEVDGSSRVV